MQNPDMEFKIMFDDLTKEDNLLKPDEEGMSKQELIEEFKNRMGYIDEAVGQMHHLTNFRPATKKRLQERGNKAKNILRQEISRLENEMKSPKKKKKKVKYDKEGKLTPEEISFILSPESSFNVGPDFTFQRGGKRKTRRRKRKTKRKKKRKTKRKKKRKRRRGGMNGSTGGTDSTPLPRPSTSPGSTGSRDLDDEARRRIQEERIAERRRILQVHAQENARVMRIIERERQARRAALSKEGSSGRGLGGGKRRKRRKTKKRRR